MTNLKRLTTAQGFLRDAAALLEDAACTDLADAITKIADGQLASDIKETRESAKTLKEIKQEELDGLARENARLNRFAQKFLRGGVPS